MNIKQALRYVRNTNGGATLADFIEDHEPIGDQLWRDLRHKLYVYEERWMR